MRYHSVLFDLDGTLIDNSEGIMNGYKYALEKLGRAGEADALPNDIIGPPLRLTFASRYGMDDAQAEEAVRIYREFFRPIGVYQSVAYPYVEDMLRRLQEAGVGIFLATSKAKVFAETILNHLGLIKYFDGVVGSELDGRMDNKRDIIEHIMSGMLKPGQTAVMAGDRYHDAKGAQEAGMDAIVALWGFSKAEEFAPYDNVVAMFQDAREMCDWLLGE